MPILHNQINNSIDLLGWPHTLVEGKRKIAAKYTSYCSFVAMKISVKNSLWKQHAGN